MKALSLEEIRQIVGGAALTPMPQSSPLVKSVCHDTRQLESGCLFIAIHGERFDGHEFLSQAAQRGAVAAIVREIPPQANLPLIQVSDTRIALGKLAARARSHLRGKVIAVAGSNGKTSTKYLIDSVLGSKLRGSMSPKSFNNDIGVPMTILPAEASADYLVLELGTNHLGEIKNLAAIAQPDIAIITNCGAEHLEFLGDLNGVRRENASIIGSMNKNGVLIANGDDADLLAVLTPFDGNRFTFGFKTSNDLFAADVRCDSGGTRFKLNGRLEIFLPMLGRHAAANALAAIAAARAMRINDDEIVAALATARGPEMRMQLEEAGGVRMINDAYNANPNSMRAALETIASLPGRRIAIVGDMRELGESSQQYHREIGELASTCGLSLLICVGTDAKWIAEAARKSGLEAIREFVDAQSAANEVPGLVREGDLVLLKASRAIHLEIVAKAIAASRRMKMAS